MSHYTHQRLSKSISPRKLGFCEIIIIYCLIIDKRILSSEPKLLIVSYDAFRYDYFERNLTPFMSELRRSWSYTDHMLNTFITSTLPNHHSIATGLYAESHGVVDNEYYDVETRKKYKYSQEMYSYNDEVVPIWILNEMNGKHSGSMMWPGAQFEYQNLTTTFSQEFDRSINWTTRIDTVISWFKDESTPINFGLAYFEDPDEHGHAYGINHPIFNEVLQKLDNITQYLHDKLIENNLQDVNVIHLSDHGMTTVTCGDIVDVRQYLNSTDYAIAGTSLGLSVFPKPGQIESMYRKLKVFADENKNFDVCLHDAIPERYHYKNNPRVGDIFLNARKGYAFHPLADKISDYLEKFNIDITEQTEFGVHGYDNEMKEMWPFFFAYGPAFKQQCHIEPFKNIDVFPLMCEILKLKCPSHNGTLQELQHCVTFIVLDDKIRKMDLILVGSCLGIIVASFTVLACVYLRNVTKKPNLIV